MTEKQFVAPPGHDAVSRLLQLHASRHGLNLRWTGRTQEDVELLVKDCSNKTLLSQSLWNGMKELMEMKAATELPEPIQAQICAIVLKAQATFELSLGERNERVSRLTPPKLPGVL